MNLNDKKLHAASAAYILGLSPQVKISGKSSQVNSYLNVLKSSKKLYEGLHTGKSMKEIDMLLSEKKRAAANFYKEVNILWPF